VSVRSAFLAHDARPPAATFLPTVDDALAAIRDEAVSDLPS
jgi:hypothetical protein